MREPPKLAEATILEVLRERYGIVGADVAFLPLGNDTAASVYRVDAAGAAYLLKARAEPGFSPAGLAVPRHLCDQGVPHIVAPIPTAAGALWVDLGDFGLSLYPFVEGRTAVEAGMSQEHWRALGAAVRRVHASRLPPDLLPAVRREPFVPDGRERLAALEAALGAPADPLAREVAACWREHRADIRALLERADTLGRTLRREGAPLVLCHADLHTWNILVDSGRRLWLVDWDQSMLALKERDLMFVVGGIGRGLVAPRETAWFLQGYGDTAVDPRALAYYRAAWAVQDIISFSEQAVLNPDASPAARREGLQYLLVQFEPGNIVAIALGDEGLGGTG